jgi:hypothetical protein
LFPLLQFSDPSTHDFHTYHSRYLSIVILASNTSCKFANF